MNRTLRSCLRQPHVCLISVSAFLVFSACTGSPANSSNNSTPTLSGPPNTTFPMPPLKGASLAELGWVLPTSDDTLGRAKVGDYAGKVLVLDFYATWCAPCRESVPMLVDLQKRYGEQGLEVVGLNVGGPDDRVKVREFAKEFNIQYSLGFPDRALTDFLMPNDTSIPQTFIFKRDGTLAKHVVGFDSNAREVFEMTIQTELNTR